MIALLVFGMTFSGCGLSSGTEKTAESEDYSMATAETVKDGVKGKAGILVGLNVTDNYILIIGGDEDKFNANEKMVDEVWGSFEMWSGGASGN